MGVLVDEQATISNSVQTASSPAHQERTVNGRWGTGVWGMEWAEYTGNTPRRKDQGWAKWLPNKRPSRGGEDSVNLAEAVRFELTNPCGLPVFKTGAIDHSATLPSLEF